MIFVYLKHLNGYFNDNTRCFNGYRKHLSISCICISIIWMLLMKKMSLIFFKRQNVVNFLILFFSIWLVNPPNPSTRGGLGWVGIFLTHLKESSTGSTRLIVNPRGSGWPIFIVLNFTIITLKVITTLICDWLIVYNSFTLSMYYH